MGFRWKVTLADGSVQYPVSTKKVNGLPKIETPGYVTQIPLLITHPSDVGVYDVGYEIAQAIHQWSPSLGYISHGKTFNACVKTLRVKPVSSTPPVYRGENGNEFCIGNAVLEFEFLPGYGDDITDAELLRKLTLIRGNIDSHLDDIWPMSMTNVSLLGGVYH